MAFFWASSGRGGGPVISENLLLRTLAEQDVPLEFDFYVEEAEASEGVVY